MLGRAMKSEVTIISKVLTLLDGQVRRDKAHCGQPARLWTCVRLAADGDGWMVHVAKICAESMSRR